ncbi:MAG: DEAD/DEAH box helicase [Pseudomonadales bacterium]|nr:DEAD/DEAH box helicase [Pseudomonadales bacterium]
MAFVLRDYQQQAVDATIAHFKKSNEAAMIVLPTGAGKSLVIAELARRAKGKVLVLAHVKELVEQNHDKFISYGIEAGIFSAGLKQKDLHHRVPFASIQSVARNLPLFAQQHSLLIIDECHRVNIQEAESDELIPGKTNGKTQYQLLIEQLCQNNASFKVFGLTATPYRLGSGWIYQYHHQGFVRTTDERLFISCVYELPLRYMIKNNYLTVPKLIDASISHYDFSQLTASSQGQYSEKAMNILLHKHRRVTKGISEQIVELAKDRKGVMIFAATVDHAKEIYAYLQQQGIHDAALITGATEASQRDEIINTFKQQQLKYLINVSVLTTGFDAPHVDMIAILRPTQSVSLYQQIIGRGLRLAPDKKDCLVIDYAGNGYDIYQPEIGEDKPNSQSVPVSIPCPVCEFHNSFWGIVDDDGDLIEHYGRRCQSIEEIDGARRRCQFRFRFKQCPDCMQENDIAARRCEHCDKVLIDPDEKLKQALNLKNAMVIRCSGMRFSDNKGRLKIHYYDEDGLELTESFDLNHKGQCFYFNQSFGPRFAQGLLNTTQRPYFTKLEELLDKSHLFSAPDFVIARKQKYYWQIQEKIYDYQGPYRLANGLS